MENLPLALEDRVVGMPVKTEFSPEEHLRKIFNSGGREDVISVIVGSAEVMEVWHLGDISACVRHEDFLRAQSLLTAGLRFLYAQGHNGKEATEQQLESIRHDTLLDARRIIRG